MMNNKQLPLGVLVGIVMISLLPAAFGQTISIGSVTLSPNGTATTAITLTGMNDFGVAAIDLYYNQNVVNVMGATIGFTGYGGSLTPNIQNTIGKARFVITTTAIPGPNSPITLVNVNLKAVGAASQTSALGLVIPTLSTTSGNPVTPTVQNGTATIGGTIGGGAGNDTIGLYQVSTGIYFMKNSNRGGIADITVSYGPGGSDFVPVAGDCNGDGIDSIALYRTSTGTFYLKNSNSGGVADITVKFGPSGSDFLPVVGDWNGDGTDTIGLYQKSTGIFFLKNSNGGGAADITVQFGPGGSDFLPVVGDWNGDGTDTIGLYQKSTGTFFLKNSNSAGAADITVQYGPGGSDFLPVVGDWNGDGTDTIGIYRVGTGTFYLKNSNSGGAADITAGYGPGGSDFQPIIGNWDGK